MSLGDRMSQDTGDILQRLQIYPVSPCSVLGFSGNCLPTSVAQGNELGNKRQGLLRARRAAALVQTQPFMPEVSLAVAGDQKTFSVQPVLTPVTLEQVVEARK